MKYGLNKHMLFSFSMILIVFIGLTACTRNSAELGSPENPIKFYLVPAHDMMTLLEQGKVLEAYLPAQMGKEQIEKLVTEVIAATGAKTIKDMGTVMKEVQTRAAGSADGKMISEVIKSKLT